MNRMCKCSVSVVLQQNPHFSEYYVHNYSCTLELFEGFKMKIYNKKIYNLFI